MRQEPRIKEEMVVTFNLKSSGKILEGETITQIIPCGISLNALYNSRPLFKLFCLE